MALALKLKVMPLTCLSIQQSEQLLKHGLLNALPNFTSVQGMLHLWNGWRTPPYESPMLQPNKLSDNLSAARCFHLQRIR